MAKTTTKLSVSHAEKILHGLETKKAELASARVNDEAAMATVSYEAHTGCEKSTAKLETLRDRAIRRDVEDRNLDSAIAEAKRRVAAAQDAERRAEEAKIAAELVELAGMLREAGAKADRGLKLLVEGSGGLQKIIAAMQERGLGNPNAQQLLSLGSRAILAAIMDSPFSKAFETIAPRERKNFAQFTASWANAVDHAASIKLNKEGGEENAA